jgi:uncharacterized RmlC-like cupin family protein
MHREMAASSDRSWAGYVTTEAGMVSAWHHHADFESHIYVLAGVMRIESGPEGEHVIEAHAGDFIFVPPQTIHREINPGSEPSVVVVVRAGTGEAVVNVDGPGPS